MSVHPDFRQTHFICIHCNRMVERCTYNQHHCPFLDELRSRLNEATLTSQYQKIMRFIQAANETVPPR